MLERAFVPITELWNLMNEYLNFAQLKSYGVPFKLDLLKKREADGRFPRRYENLINGPASMIFPKASLYDRDTASGVGRSWICPIHL